MSGAVEAIYDRHDAFMTRAEAVEAALKNRPFLGLNPTFDPTKDLSEAAQKRLKALDEHLAANREIALESRLQGGRYLVNELGAYVRGDDDKLVFEAYPEGVLDVYGLRNPGYIVTRWLVAFDELGRAQDLTELVRVADQLERRLKDTGQGYREFVNWANPADPRALDQLLITGWLAAIDRALWQNRDSPLVPKEVQERFSRMMNEDILKGLFYRALQQSKEGGAEKRAARLALWKSAGCNKRYDPKDKSTLSIRAIFDLYTPKGLYTAYDRYGGAIYHPLMSLHCFAQIRSNQYGWEEDKEVAERTDKQLVACRKLIDSPKGQLEQHPHFVPERVRYIGLYWENITPELPDDAYDPVDITYPRESSMTEELARRAGSPYCTEELAGSFARSLAWCALAFGPKSDKISATAAGTGDKRLNGQRVVSIRNGEHVVASPYRLRRAEKTEAVSQLSRGDSALGLRFADKATQGELRALNDRYQVKDQGHALSLMLCETRRL